MNLFPVKLSSFELVEKTRKEFEKIYLRDFAIDTVPVVYIQRDDKNLYIGKSTDIYGRFPSHLKDISKTFKEIIIIKSDLFNESSIKHIETLLIDYLAANKNYNLLNKIKGQNIHHYNGIEDVYSMFEKFGINLWKRVLLVSRLKKLKISSYINIHRLKNYWAIKLMFVKMF
jgi:uncharacterized protein